jgi:hypothetical protein
LPDIAGHYPAKRPKTNSNDYKVLARYPAKSGHLPDINRTLQEKIMSANAMKPTFTDRESYLRWRAEWKVVYKALSQQIVEGKLKVSLAASQKSPEAPAMQRELKIKRVMAHKMMTLMEEAKLRRDRILDMHKQMAEQNAKFPMLIEDCRNIDFHFNKGSLEFPFLPMWALKTKGMTFYVNHIEANIPWSTRELPEGSTRGMIRLKNGEIAIDAEGNAAINKKAVKPMLQAVA